MAKNDNLKDFLTDVADAIREKKGTTDLINPQDFSAEIASIQSGGGAVAVSAKAVNFRDYDGTILHSYTKDEFLALSAMPELPTREGLICQEWNWDFADAVEYVSEYGVLEVGATYITDDGKTRLYITIAAEGRMDVPLYFNQTVANGVTIDWGDGSATETLSGTGNKNTTHHYNAIGDYVISLEVADGCTLSLGHNTTSYCVLGNTGTNGRVYCNMLKKIELGGGITGINAHMVRYCYCIGHISIPNNITTMGQEAFRYCASFASIVIPKSVRNLPSRIFSNCPTLSFVSIPPSCTEITGYTFSSCAALASVIIPKGITLLSGSTFSSCKALASVVLPKGMTTISGDSFSACESLTSVVIPKGVTAINSGTFYYCYGMGFYDFSEFESVPSLSSTSAFSGIPSDCKIIVPDALYDTWIAATNWSTYASYIIKKSDWDALNA